MDLEKDFLKPGLEVSHKDGRRGKVLTIGYRKVQVEWNQQVQDINGGKQYSTIKVRRTWVLFGKITKVHLPVIKR